MEKTKISRREFMASSGLLAGTAILGNLPFEKVSANDFIEEAAAKKMRVALVGTGIRGITMWGKDLVRDYPDLIEFVGLCDINEGRLNFASQHIGAGCPTFLDFDEMMRTTKPDVLIVCTIDCTHHEFIIKGMEYGADIITEKPMTIAEQKIQAILNAEKRTGKKVRVTFNYRYSPHRAKMWELLRNGEIGELTSVDFHWYLNTSHGADYFRRWHRKIENSGSLLLHKACHHFDLLNWWIDRVISFAASGAAGAAASVAAGAAASVAAGAAALVSSTVCTEQAPRDSTMTTANARAINFFIVFPPNNNDTMYASRRKAVGAGFGWRFFYLIIPTISKIILLHPFSNVNNSLKRNFIKYGKSKKISVLHMKTFPISAH